MIVAGIRVQFVCGQDLASQLISWYGSGYGGFSHVDAVMPDGRLLGARDDAPDGSLAGVRIRPANYEVWARQEVLELPAPHIVASKWVAWLYSQQGRPYDIGSIWGFILGRDLHQKGHWICSQLQLEALEECGLMPHLETPKQQVTPGSLRLMLLALGAKSILKRNL